MIFLHIPTIIKVKSCSLGSLIMSGLEVVSIMWKVTSFKSGWFIPSPHKNWLFSTSTGVFSIKTCGMSEELNLLGPKTIWHPFQMLCGSWNCNAKASPKNNRSAHKKFFNYASKYLGDGLDLIVKRNQKKGMISTSELRDLGLKTRKKSSTSCASTVSTWPNVAAQCRAVRPFRSRPAEDQLQHPSQHSWRISVSDVCRYFTMV